MEIILTWAYYRAPFLSGNFSGMSYCFSITFYYFFINTVGKSHFFQDTLMLVRTLWRLTMSQDSGPRPSFSSIELCSFFLLLKELAFIGLFSFGLTYIIHFIVYIFQQKNTHSTMQINLLIKLKGGMTYTEQPGEEAPHVSTMVHVMSHRTQAPTVLPGRDKAKLPWVKMLKELWQKVVQRAVFPSQRAVTHQVSTKYWGTSRRSKGRGGKEIKVVFCQWHKRT